MTHLLEYIPCSRDEDIGRFMKYFDRMISEGEIDKHTRKYQSTRGKCLHIEEEMTPDESKKMMKDLSAAIKGNMDKRGDQFAMLLAKYSTGHDVKAVGYEEDDEEEEEDEIEEVKKKKVTKKTKKKDTTTSSSSKPLKKKNPGKP